MDIIKKPDDLILSILGDVDINLNKSYKLSNYICTCDYKDKKLVFSTLTKALYALVSEEEYDFTHPERLDSELKRQLAKERIFVPIDLDEYSLVNQTRKIFNLLNCNKTDFIDNYTILTTTDCNARCFYCYELGLKRTTMTSETALSVAEYIKNNCKNRKVYLRWFGGEPLCNYEVIDIITSELRKCKIPFVSKMTTNGYLFDERMIDKAVNQWNLDKVQITLDGTEKLYNRFKAFIYKNDESPFIKVTNNIDKILKANITVNIRLNMSQENADDLIKLVSWIPKRYSHADNLHIYPAIIFDKNDIKSLSDRILLLDKYSQLSEFICEKKLSRYRLDGRPFKSNSCMADAANAVVITPDGDLQRCEHITENETFGNIWKGLVNKEIYNSWLENQPEISECKSCAFYTSCRPLKKCKTFIKCTEDERIGKKIHCVDAMRWEYENR